MKKAIGTLLSGLVLAAMATFTQEYRTIPLGQVDTPWETVQVGQFGGSLVVGQLSSPRMFNHHPLSLEPGESADGRRASSPVRDVDDHLSTQHAMELKPILEDVTGATAYRYNAVDDQGQSMDCLKVLESPAGGYLGVYHVFIKGTFRAWLATSQDLLHWSFVRELQVDGHQPTIAKTPDGGFVVALELSEPDGGSHIRFHYYESLSALQTSPPQRTLDAPRTAYFNAPCEGTPNIYSVEFSPDVDNSKILVGFHFYENGDVDRVGVGLLTNFNSWVARAKNAYNDQLLDMGVQGNVGDRDHIMYGDHKYNVQEGQLIKDDWSSWRCFLYSYQDDAFSRLQVKTHGGSTAFGNPTVTRLRSPDGVDSLVITYFLFSEGAAPGEAGPLVFFHKLQQEEVPSGDDDASGRDDDIAAGGDDVDGPWLYEAETDLSHCVGYADGEGWAAATTTDVEGHMCYGPYTTDIPAGTHTASFRLMIDVNDTDNLVVATIDVYDASADEILALRDIRRSEFVSTFAYQDFELTFDNVAAHSLEFRTYWHDVAYINQDHVLVLN